MAPNHPRPAGYGNAGQDFTYIRNHEGHIPLSSDDGAEDNDDDFAESRNEATWDTIFNPSTGEDT